MPVEVIMYRSNRKPSLSRRDFLQFVLSLGGITAAPSFLSSFGSVSETNYMLSPANPSSGSDENDLAKIAFIKTSDRAEGVQRAIDLLGINPVEGKKVLLKPNLNSADPAPGSTHPDVLRELITKLNKMGAAKITVGDRSGMGNTRRVMKSLGIFKLAAELDFETLVFDELGAEDWVMIDATNSHWQDGFPFARPCLEADALVQACCLKTHQYGGQFTMSLKNTVGMVAKQLPGGSHNYMQELHGSDFQRQMIAEMNTAYQPALILLDGVEAFISGGPDKGQKVSSEVVLAGTDRVAIDAVGVALLRYHGNTTNVANGPIFEQDQIARAVALGLGVDGPNKIELLTDDEAGAVYAGEIKELLLEA
jgi:uncharacterized protein (DUF362 family)